MTQELNNEAKQGNEVIEDNFDEQFDKQYDKFFEQETPESTSISKETTGDNPENQKEDEGTNLAKKSASEKEDGEKPDNKDDEVPEEFHKHPAWQRMLQQRDEAIKKAEQNVIDEDTKKQLEEFKRVTSSPEYIRASMKEQGYTEEAINNKLREAGHQVNEPVSSDDITSVVFKELGINEDSVEPQVKAVVKDISSIVDVILKNKFPQMIEGKLNPLQENLQSITQRDAATKLTTKMKSIIDSEKILDWKTEIEPEISKFLDENSNITQEDVFAHFEKISRELSFKKLRTIQNKNERDKKKEGLESKVHNISGPRNPGQLPEKTGNFDTDFDAAYDALGL